jgi:hypothetical protein
VLAPLPVSLVAFAATENLRLYIFYAFGWLVPIKGPQRGAVGNPGCRIRTDPVDHHCSLASVRTQQLLMTPPLQRLNIKRSKGINP